jgi:hypothetical protein
MRWISLGVRPFLPIALLLTTLVLAALDGCTTVPRADPPAVAGSTTSGSSGAGGARASSTSSSTVAVGTTTSSSSSGAGGAPVCGPDAGPADGGTCTVVAVCDGGCGATGTTCTPTGCGDWARWPMPNPPSMGLPNAASYSVDAGAGVVVDNVTKLTWQQPIGDAGSCSNGCTATAAADYCNNLVLAGAQWRLPTRIELVSIQDYTQTNGVFINPTYFPGTPAGFFWTSTPVASTPGANGYAGYAWGVDFQLGTNEPEPSTMSFHVRCVH